MPRKKSSKRGYRGSEEQTPQREEPGAENVRSDQSQLTREDESQALGPRGGLASAEVHKPQYETLWQGRKGEQIFACGITTANPDQESVLEDVAGLSLKPTRSNNKFPMAERPGFGRLGDKIELIANYYTLNFENINIYHYDVDIFFRAEVEEVVVTEEDVMVKEVVQFRKGVSVFKQGRTAKQDKEDIEKRISHVEHQQKRVPGRKLCRRVITTMISMEGLERYNPVYDGEKNIYSTVPLPVTKRVNFSVSLNEDNRCREFEVFIQPVVKGTGSNLVNIELLNEVYRGGSKEVPQEILMVFDTVLCHRSPPFHQMQVGRSFFMLDHSHYSVGNGNEVWFGYNQSVHLTQRGPQVVLNLAAKAFHTPGPVIDYISDFLRKDIRKFEITPKEIEDMSSALTGVRICVTHRETYKRKYTILCVTAKTASEIRFKDANGQDTTMEKYFLDVYRCKLRYPYLPCLQIKKKEETYFPMELCEILPNQPVLRELSTKTVQEMIKLTAKPPEIRFKSIENERQELLEVSGEAMNNFGLSLGQEPMQLVGRVIVKPGLRYGNTPKSVVKPDNCGKWKMDRQKFFRPCGSCSWMLFSFATLSEESMKKSHCKSLETFAELLVNCASHDGISLEEVKKILYFEEEVGIYEVLKYAKDHNVKFVVIIMSRKCKWFNYDELKFIADIKLHLVTQCMDYEVFHKRIVNGKKGIERQVASNILLKINSKLGGVNHILLQNPLIGGINDTRLQNTDEQVIIFGADAAHSPRGFDCPSIAALVGSLDENFCRYAVTCRVQENADGTKISQEIIKDLKNMAKCVLETFRGTKGRYPNKVIFFRDGVSEGQFKTVLEQEVAMIKDAFRDVIKRDSPLPPLTYIVVQKRHQTRFRPKNESDGVGRMCNIPPGTVVDTDVTHPIFFDFFLCSHEGIQGTSKPAHYTVIFDENNFSTDGLQKLCYNLCYVYARCNRSISVPPPIMYADLACTRARKYALVFLKNVPKTPGGVRKLPEEAVKVINEDVSTIDSSMFFL